MLIFLYFPFLCLSSCPEPGHHCGAVAVVHLPPSFVAADSSPRGSALPSQRSSKALPAFFVVFFRGANSGAGSTSCDLALSVAMKK